MKTRRYKFVCVMATLAALSIGAANKIRLGPPPDATPHLARVREAATKATGEVAGMIVKPGHLPRQAFELLRPNVLEARSYTNLANNDTFSVLLVHCGDIADMGAHYPPACYPGSGFTVVSTTPMPLELNGRTLNGVEYELQPSRSDDREGFRIWNCMFLPNGTSTYLPKQLRRAARLDNMRHYGSGQIQVLVRTSLELEQRTAIYHDALRIYEPAIVAMMSDPRGAGAATTETFHEPQQAGWP